MLEGGVSTTEAKRGGVMAVDGGDVGDAMEVIVWVGCKRDTGGMGYDGWINVSMGGSAALRDSPVFEGELFGFGEGNMKEMDCGCAG